MYIGLLVKFPLAWQILFINIEYCRQVLAKSSNMKLHEEPSSGD